MPTATAQAELLPLVASLVAAHVKSNVVDPEALPEVIRLVYDTLSRLGSEPDPSAEQPKRVPAVPVRKSVFPDYIVCLEDGLRFQSMKRHLASTYGITPEDYRERWGLPLDYPMVAPNYTTRRSNLAKAAGLGRKDRTEVVEHHQDDIGKLQRIPEGRSGLKAARHKAVS